MKIKTRLSFQFTILVSTVLILFSLLVYYFSITSQKIKFRENLLNRAKNTAILLIDVKEVDSTLLKKIHQSTISWKNEEIALTDSTYKIIYSNNINYITNLVIKNNSGDDKFFSVAEKEGVCYKHILNKRSYYVFVMAYDIARRENLSELQKILGWSIIFSIWISVLLSYFFSKKAIQPISKLIKSMKEINSEKLNKRLDEGNRKDEIEILAITFNELLSNLEIAFKNQEEFVANASHELRTPLSVMIAETDYIITREQSNKDYLHHILKMETDLKNLNALINSLLELAQINRDHKIQFSEVRIDEIIYNSIHQVKARYPNRKIISKIQYPENEKILLIPGNPGLLTIAFNNLLDNACKFSSEDVNIEILITEPSIKIIISDSGIGIPSNEMESIYKPFKRGSNVRYKGGFGIGLSLVIKIIELHNAELKAFSNENIGSRFEIIFYKLNHSKNM